MGDDFAIGVEQGIDHFYSLVGGVDVIYVYFTIVDVDTPLFDMDGVGCGEPYMAVDATTRVPTGVGLVGVVNSDGYYVLTLVYIGGDIVLETAIAIRAKAYLMAVNEYRRIHVDSVEGEEKVR
jgi:hypothetical protein